MNTRRFTHSFDVKCISIQCTSNVLPKFIFAAFNFTSVSDAMSKKQVGKYMLDKRIGKGSYAQVWLGHCEDTQETVAVKVISRHTVSETAQLRQEVVVLKKIDHVNIVKFKDLKKSVGHYYLVLEYCQGGDLARFIQKRGKIREESTQRFLQQLSAGLLVLHRLNFIHRDLKPQNILLSEDTEEATLKIADFGFARALSPTDMAATVCGSPLYMAPEILRHERYDARADLWSLGSIVFELVFGHPPFSGPNPMQLLATIESSPKRIVFPKTVHISDSFKSLLSQVLVKDPDERISPEGFFSHEYNLGKGFTDSENATRVPDDFLQADEDLTVIEETSPINIEELTRREEESEQLVCISFGQEASAAPPPTGDKSTSSTTEPVMLLTGVMQVLSEAVSLQASGPLAETYAGTQTAIGILLRHVATEMVISDDTRAVDALGVAAKSCQFLESALDEAVDKRARSLIDMELKASMEAAFNIRSKLTYRGFTESAKPLRWVYSFLLHLLQLSTREPEKEKRGVINQCGMLLIDLLVNELEQVDSTGKAEEDVKLNLEDVLGKMRSALMLEDLSHQTSAIT